MKNKTNWILVFINFFLVIISIQRLSDKIERLEEKSGKVSIQCDSLQNELNLLNKNIYNRGAD